MIASNGPEAATNACRLSWWPLQHAPIPRLYEPRRFVQLYKANCHAHTRMSLASIQSLGNQTIMLVERLFREPTGWPLSVPNPQSVARHTSWWRTLVGERSF